MREGIREFHLLPSVDDILDEEIYLNPVCYFNSGNHAMKIIELLTRYNHE